MTASFERMTYTDAIAALEKSGKSFEFPVRWGMDLQSEHERWLTEEHVGRPVVVMNYPKEIKAFYMRLNDDGKTVAAMDVLAPGIGEIIGGSQREERLDVLDRRLAEQDLDPKAYWWYRDLRRYGTVPHAGFGLGLERTIIYATGMANIRDVIPFPRAPGAGSLMRMGFLRMLLSALALPGCVTVLSHSYSNASVSNASVEHRPFVSESKSDWGVLRLTIPTIENIVLDLEQRIGVACPGGRLINVQTTLALREFLVVQIYSVRLTAQCMAANPPGSGSDVGQQAPRSTGEPSRVGARSRVDLLVSARPEIRVAESGAREARARRT